ncbi:MAG: murein L,D-transpeptidase family protein [Verrucomicrobiota bacterium]
MSSPELPDLLPVGGAPANQVKGGSSPIKSSDPNRATKAKNRVTPILKKELEAKGLKFGSPIFLRIFKESHELELWVKGSDGTFDLFKNYRISAMSGKLGPKEKQGDFQAPEGFYFVNSGRFNPYSSYHLSFNIGYPNTYDRAHQRTGSLIMIHGKSVSIGCFAMTDSSIEEIYTLGDAALKNGQPFFRVHSFPFRMSKERLAAEAKSKHIDFWNNLYDGFLAFEKSKIPPNVTVRSKRYAFGKG